MGPFPEKWRATRWVCSELLWNVLLWNVLLWNVLLWNDLLWNDSFRPFSERHFLLCLNPIASLLFTDYYSMFSYFTRQFLPYIVSNNATWDLSGSKVWYNVFVGAG